MLEGRVVISLKIDFILKKSYTFCRYPLTFHIDNLTRHLRCDINQ